MSYGAYISGATHAGFIAALLLGGIFDNNRLPELEVADVTILSEEEFAALVPPQEGPEITSDASEIEAPAEDTAPEVSAAEDVVPDPAELAQPSEPSDADQSAEPLPLPNAVDAEVSDNVTIVDAPAIIDDRPEAPTEAEPAPAPRVAPQPAAPAPPQAEEAPELVQETAPAPAPEPPQPQEEATAPPEATTEIVTEAEQQKELAPASSPRPKSRPRRPQPTEVVEEDPAEETPVDDPVAAAVAAALAEQSTPAAAPSGPPLTGGEKDALRIAVQDCWVVDVGSRSADVTVTVAVSMSPDGTVSGDVRQVSASGGDESAQRTAYEAARRAILRCQRGGYPLPVEKYDHWRDIEMTFNPEGMRLK